GDNGDVAPADASGDQTYSVPVTAAQRDNSAHVTVKVPADARVWFDGVAMKSTGPVRQYDSPALKPGARYHYQVRARWKENGHEVAQTQEVRVRAGARVQVDFPTPRKAAGSALSKGQR